MTARRIFRGKTDERRVMVEERNPGEQREPTPGYLSLWLEEVFFDRREAR